MLPTDIDPCGKDPESECKVGSPSPPNPPPANSPRLSTLEAWAQDYDSKKIAANNGILSLTSAFRRPTYTAVVPSHVNSSASIIPTFDTRINAVTRSASSSISSTSAFCGTFDTISVSSASSANSSTSSSPIFDTRSICVAHSPIPRFASNNPAILSSIDALIEECKAQASVTISESQPEEPMWLITATSTLPELSYSLHRLCSEINWDWYAQKYNILNPGSTCILSTIWRTMVGAMYEYYCVEKAVPERTVWKALVLKEGSDEGALRHYRCQVHNMMMMFAGVEGSARNEGVVEVITSEGLEKMKLFYYTLFSGGGVLRFPREKAHSVGLDYPGGTGDSKKRIENLVLAKRKLEDERARGY